MGLDRNVLKSRGRDPIPFAHKIVTTKTISEYDQDSLLFYITLCIDTIKYKEFIEFSRRRKRHRNVCDT